jgi:hypothetical protein
MLATTQTSFISLQANHMLAYNAVGFDVNNGFQKDLHLWTIQAPWALKAKANRDRVYLQSKKPLLAPILMSSGKQWSPRLRALKA